MKTYTVHIESIAYYSIEVQARDQEQAEEYAWRLFPHRTAHDVQNEVTDVDCERE